MYFISTFSLHQYHKNNHHTFGSIATSELFEFKKLVLCHQPDFSFLLPKTQGFFSSFYSAFRLRLGKKTKQLKESKNTVAEINRIDYRQHQH